MEIKYGLKIDEKIGLVGIKMSDWYFDCYQYVVDNFRERKIMNDFVSEIRSDSNSKTITMIVLSDVLKDKDRFDKFINDIIKLKMKYFMEYTKRMVDFDSDDGWETISFGDGKE